VPPKSSFSVFQLRRLFLLAALLLPLSTVRPEDTPSPSTIPTLQDDWGNIHNQFVADAKARADKINIVFAGDSISARWTLGAGRDIWAKRYAPLGAINLSISADDAQDLLWRLENGEIAPLHPKMLILLIGANNLSQSPEAVAYGVWANVAYIRKTLPDTRVLVQGIFERENPPADAGRNAKVNTLLARLDDGKMVKFLDFSSKFLKPDGTLDRTVFTDGCHPEKPAGFQVWADSIQPVIDQWMTQPPVPGLPPPPSPVGEPKDPAWGTPVRRNDFLFRHNRYLMFASKFKCDLLFLGGTAMAAWDRLEPLTKQEYAKYRFLNFAIHAARTENILWQLTNGEIDHLQPEARRRPGVRLNLYDKTPVAGRRRRHESHRRHHPPKASQHQSPPHRSIPQR
jgi:lysophospholipase L1-like esterase